MNLFEKTNCIIHHTGLFCLIMVCCAGLGHLQIAQFGLIGHHEAILGATQHPEQFSNTEHLVCNFLHFYVPAEVQTVV